MYSKEIEALLKKEGLKIGERIKIIKAGKSYDGLLIQAPEFGIVDSIVIKLDSGYNIGIKFEKGTEIEKTTGERHVLGRVKKELLEMKFDSKKPPISLVFTGGTIASRVDYRTGGVHTVEDPREFLHNIPELAGIVKLKSISTPVKKMSEDMDPEDWTEIAKAVAKELNSDSKGVIVTHGTDTMHYTAAALSFFLRNLHKPVVFVGAQKSADRASSDAGINVICAAHAAVGDIAEVMTCMHGSLEDDHCLLIRGTKVRKMDTVRRDAFRPINDLPIAKIWPNGKQETLGKYKKRGAGKVELDARFEAKIAQVRIHPGADPGVIDYYVKKGYKGFVLMGTGLGHVPGNESRSNWTEKIKSHTSSGIPFVIASQTIYGRVNPDVYTNLRRIFHEAGAIPGQDMHSETAFVKLGWVLAHTKNMEKVREMMLTNYAGEITEKTLPETYLY